MRLLRQQTRHVSVSLLITRRERQGSPQWYAWHEPAAVNWASFESMGMQQFLAGKPNHAKPFHSPVRTLTVSRPSRDTLSRLSLSVEETSHRHLQPIRSA